MTTTTNTELLEACKLALLAIPSKADGELGKMIRLARRKIISAIKNAESTHPTTKGNIHV